MWSGSITKSKRVLRHAVAPWPQNLAVGLFNTLFNNSSSQSYLIPLALIRNDLTPSMSSHFVDPSHSTLDEVSSPADQHFHKMLNGRHVKAYGDGQHWCNNFICLGNLRHRAPVISRILLELRVTATALNFTHTITFKDSGSLRHSERPGRYNTEPVNRPVVILARNQRA